MAIFACPKCSQHLSVPDSAAGQTVACPKCGQALAIPAAAPAPLPTQQIAPGPPPLRADGAAPAASMRLPTNVLTRLPKPILFALFGAVGALAGAILVELPFHLAKPAAAAGTAKTTAEVDIMFVLDVLGLL